MISGHEPGICRLDIPSAHPGRGIGRNVAQGAGPAAVQCRADDCGASAARTGARSGGDGRQDDQYLRLSMPLVRHEKTSSRAGFFMAARLDSEDGGEDGYGKIPERPPTSPGKWRLHFTV